MSTTDNLQAAFAGESQANRKYLAFAKKAESDGFPTIARLFRAAAEAETIHAHAHLRVLGGVKTTAENLQAAADGEAYEFREMYPGFVEQARADGNEPALRSFSLAMAAEKVHHALYCKAVERLKSGKDLPALKLYVCPVCGHLEWGEAPESCPICKARRERFSEVK